MYQINRLKKFKQLVHGFSTTKDGNMSFLLGSKKDVQENRRKFLVKLGIRLEECVALKAQHKDKIVVVDKKFAGIGMTNTKDAIRADGLITNVRGLFLFLLIADCLPIIVFDPKKEVIGLIHAGWRSTTKKIITKVVKLMNEEYDSNPADLHVGIGPCIHKESYKFNDPVQMTFKDWKPFLVRYSGGLTGINLLGYNNYLLKQSGVKDKNIFASKIDTATDKRFYSHYKDVQKGRVDQGRFAFVIGLKPQQWRR